MLSARTTLHCKTYIAAAERYLPNDGIGCTVADNVAARLTHAVTASGASTP